MIFSSGYAQAEELKTVLGAKLLRAAGYAITGEDYKKLSFNRCGAIKKYVGFSDTPLDQSMRYSCSGLVIGITLYAGEDLGTHSPEKVAKLFETRLSEQAMTARVFIKPNHEYGSAMAFFINGESYTRDWVGPLEALKLLDAMAAETRLIYFKNNQITSAQLGQWIKGKPPASLMY